MLVYKHKLLFHSFFISCFPQLFPCTICIIHCGLCMGFKGGLTPLLYTMVASYESIKRNSPGHTQQTKYIYVHTVSLYWWLKIVKHFCGSLTTMYLDIVVSSMRTMYVLICEMCDCQFEHACITCCHLTILKTQLLLLLFSV